MMFLSGMPIQGAASNKGAVAATIALVAAACFQA
jgi:hypothetical protein